MKQHILLGLALVASSAFAQSVSTGVAPWLVNGNPTVNETGTLLNTWVPALGDGLWVGTRSTDGNFILPTDGAAGGTYTFSLNVGALYGTAGNFSLQYAADNAVSWSVNDGTLSGDTQCGNGDPLADCYSALRTLAGTFSANSVLTATVVNGTSIAGGSPMGFLAVSSISPIPEPSSYAMFLVGAALVGGTLARRARAPTRRPD